MKVHYDRMIEITNRRVTEALEKVDLEDKEDNGVLAR